VEIDHFALGDFIPFKLTFTNRNTPEKAKKRDRPPTFLRWRFTEFKRSFSDYQATATGSFALLRFRFVLSAFVIASASATASTSSKHDLISSPS
jgi:hypothetical protein